MPSLQDAINKTQSLISNTLTGADVQNFSVDRIGGLSEAVFDDSTRKVRVTVIKAGWSKNGVYYSLPVLEEIRLALLANAKKVYMDHHPDGAVARRSVSDWIANVTGAVLEGDELKADILVHESGPHAWIYDRMRTSPDMFGPSIVGLAEVKQGEEEGIKGKVVKRLRFLRSFDIVSDPAAGGKHDGIVEDYNIWGQGEEIQEAKLAERIARLKEREANSKISDELWTVMSAFQGLVFDLYLARDGAEGSKEKVRREEITVALKDLGSSLSKIKMAKAKKPKAEDGSKTMEEDEDKNLEEDNNKPILTTLEETVMTLAELRANHPNLVATLLEEHKMSQDAETLTTKVTELTESNTALKDQATKLDEENVKLKTDNTKLTEDIKKFEAESAVRNQEKIIEEVIKETKLEEDAVTEVFRDTLKEVSEDTEDALRAKLKTLCEDRLKLTVKTDRTAGVDTGGVTKPKVKSEDGNLSEEEKHPVTNDEFAEGVFGGKRNKKKTA